MLRSGSCSSTPRRRGPRLSIPRTVSREGRDGYSDDLARLCGTARYLSNVWKIPARREAAPYAAAPAARSGSVHRARARPGKSPRDEAFNANRCSLLNNANAVGIYTSTPDAHYETCRLHSDCSLRNRSTSRGRTIDPRSGHRVYTGSYVLRTVLGHKPRVKGSENGWSMSVNPCKRSSGCLGVLYTRSVGVLRKNAGYVKVPHVWLEAVDPDSYGLVYDREAYAMLWCRDEACPNYYRYSERPLVQRCRHRLGRTADWFRTYARPT